MGEIADFITAAEPLVRRAKDSGRIRGEPEPDEEGDAAREAVLLGNMPHRQKCPACGKIFVRKKGTGYGWDCYDTCSWTCQRKLEARCREMESNGMSEFAMQRKLHAEKRAGQSAHANERIERSTKWRADAVPMIREGADARDIAKAVQVQVGTVYRLRIEMSAKDGVNYAALAREKKREKKKSVEKNIETAKRMLLDGASWKDILRAAHIGAKDLARIRQEMDMEAEALSAAAAAAPPEGEPSGRVEATDAPENPPTGDAAKEVQEGDRKALLQDEPSQALRASSPRGGAKSDDGTAADAPENPPTGDAAKEVQEGDRKALLQTEIPTKRKRIAAKPAAPSEIGRRLSDRDERELLWAAGVIEMYIDIRPDNSAGRRAVAILRRIAGLED